MSFVADLHLHSKYSRATSPKSDLENFSKWAKIKGIDLLSTGDWTHPAWLKELKEKLKPAGEGLFHLRDGHPEEQSDEGSRRIPEGHGIPRSARNDDRGGGGSGWFFLSAVGCVSRQVAGIRGC